MIPEKNGASSSASQSTPSGSFIVVDSAELGCDLDGSRDPANAGASIVFSEDDMVVSENEREFPESWSRSGDSSDVAGAESLGFVEVGLENLMSV